MDTKELQHLKQDFTNPEIALLSIAAGIEKKATRPVILDLKNIPAFTEYFAILSASNTRQVYAVADGIKTFFKTHLNLSPVSVDGLESCSWVLLDYGFLFVHIFQETTREVYQLEKLWNNAYFVPVNEEEYTSLYNKALELNSSQNSSESEN